VPPVAAPDIIRPAFLSRPAIAVGDLGDEVAELAEQLGQDVGPEERIALSALTPVKADGMPAGLAAGIVCGRQNIKSWALEMCTIHDAWVTKVGRCFWSAHQTKTSDDNFNHLIGLVENFDWLRKRVKRIYTGNGDHRILFLDGRTIEFTARENGPTGRGRVKVNRLTLDEALFLTPAMLGAFIPTMGAAGDRYLRYGSSPGRLHSAELRRIRDRGRRGDDPSLSWCEWTSERLVDGKRVTPECADPECSHLAGVAVGCWLDDRRYWRENNPAFGRRLSEEFFEQQRMELPPVEFMRECAGGWEDPPTEDADDALANWPNLADPTASPTGALRLGIDVAPNMASAALTVFGGGVVEVVAERSGSSWVPAAVAELREIHDIASVGLVRGSPAEALVPDLEGDVTMLNAADTTAACARFARAVADGAVRHRDDARLNAAVRGSRRKFSGDGWRWTRTGSDTSIAALYAGAVALWLDETGDPVYDPLDSFPEA